MVTSRPGEGRQSQAGGPRSPCPCSFSRTSCSKTRQKRIDNNLSPLLRFTHTEPFPALPAPRRLWARPRDSGHARPELPQGKGPWGGLRRQRCVRHSEARVLPQGPRAPWPGQRDWPRPRGAKTHLMRPPRRVALPGTQLPRNAGGQARGHAELTSCQSVSPYCWSTARLQLHPAPLVLRAPGRCLLLLFLLLLLLLVRLYR